jgi:hypothetical protein
MRLSTTSAVTKRPLLVVLLLAELVLGAALIAWPTSTAAVPAAAPTASVAPVAPADVLNARTLRDGRTVTLMPLGGANTTRLLEQDADTHITGYPPEAIVVGELRYALDKRGTATCELRGDVGGLGDLKKDRPEGHVERCRWWLYSAPGEDTLLVEQWGSDYRVLRGKKVGEGVIDLMQEVVELPDAAGPRDEPLDPLPPLDQLRLCVGRYGRHVCPRSPGAA